MQLLEPDGRWKLRLDAEPVNMFISFSPLSPELWKYRTAATSEPV
jgi:hypothetical protein